MTNRSVIGTAIFVMLLAAGLARSSDISPINALCIEHVGESDKPIFPVAISDTASGIEMCQKDVQERVGLLLARHVVRSELMKRLIDLVQAVSANQKEQVDGFGSLAIVIIESNKRRALTLNRANSVSLLKQLSAACSDRALRSDLTHLARRIAV